MAVRFVHRFVLTTALLSLLLAGCAMAPPWQQGATPGKGPAVPVDSKEKVIYLVPKSTDLILGRRPEDLGIVFHDALKGIGFSGKGRSKFEPNGNRATEALGCTKLDLSKNMLLCIKSQEIVLNTSMVARWYAYSMFYVAISVDDKPDQYVVTLLPTLREAQDDRSLTKSVAAPKFPESEVLDLLGQGYFRFRFEVDSQYDMESVLSNFKRLLGASRPVIQRDKAVEDKHMFQMKRDGYDANLTVEMFPYRNGSKAVVTAVVTVQPTSVEPGVSRTIDVRKVMEDVRKDVENIVKS